MKKIYLILLLITVASASALAQGKVLMGQYFQNLPAYSPSFTGVNNYIDIRTGFRKQWLGLDNSPSTGYVSIYSPIKPSPKNPYIHKSLRGSTNKKYALKVDEPKLKMGVGGYILSDKQGPLRETEVMANFAVHVPINEKMHLSLGVSGGVLQADVEGTDLTVFEDNDQTYQQYAAGDNSLSFNLNPSLGIYSDNFYFSYSAMQLAEGSISGNDALVGDAELQHNIIGGYRFHLTPTWELIPNAFIRLDEIEPNLYEGGLRARYRNNLWFGSSYRSDDTVVAMIGASFLDWIHFGYSFDYKISDYTNFNNGSHEIVIGVRLKNFSNYTSIW